MAHSQLQSATDAAALAVSAAVAANPNQTTGSLKLVAQNYINATISAAPQITDFHVCTAVIADCTDNGTQMQTGSVALSATVLVPRTVSGILMASTGSGGRAAMPVTARTVAAVNMPQTIQLNLVFDSSASMIVGATPADVTSISTWATQHWNQVHPLDPAPRYSGDNPPCAFACHDLGGATQPSDIVQGLTNAHAAGATTRWDVMISASQALISHIQSETTTQSQFKHNTYVFNVMSFDYMLHSWGSQNVNFAAATSAVNAMTPSLATGGGQTDTDLTDAMSSLITSLGKQGNGYSSSTPLKFMILITDGLQSDRNSNWSCGSWGRDPYWSYANTCFNGYAASIDTNQCQQLKSNGIILAVLETPYVPLTGQSPAVAPYEKTVRHTIYPDGPNTPSAVSQALSACATSGFYYQASTTNPQDLQQGFITLVDKFIYSTPYLMN